jgi:hypothetical protein
MGRPRQRVATNAESQRMAPTTGTMEAQWFVNRVNRPRRKARPGPRPNKPGNCSTRPNPDYERPVDSSRTVYRARDGLFCAVIGQVEAHTGLPGGRQGSAGFSNS